MDRYKEECEACWCKQATQMRHGYDVWFNCNSCPFAECYEPDTREQFLSGVTEREADYARFEEAEKLRQMEEEEYRRSQHFRRTASFAATIRKKVESKTLLSKREFAKALRLCHTRDANRLGFYAFEYLVKYQLSLLGFEGAAQELVDYIKDLEMY